MEQNDYIDNNELMEAVNTVYSAIPDVDGQYVNDKTVLFIARCHRHAGTAFNAPRVSVHSIREIAKAMLDRDLELELLKSLNMTVDDES